MTETSHDINSIRLNITTNGTIYVISGYGACVRLHSVHQFQTYEEVQAFITSFISLGSSPNPFKPFFTAYLTERAKAKQRLRYSKSLMDGHVGMNRSARVDRVEVDCVIIDDPLLKGTLFDYGEDKQAILRSYYERRLSHKKPK